MINLGGRPTKLNDVIIQKLEEAFSIGSSVEEACFYADISRATFYNWQKENPELFDRLEELKQRPIIKARQSVINGLNEPEFALKYLSKKKRDEFGDNIAVELKGELTTKEEIPEEDKVLIAKLLSLTNLDDGDTTSK